MSVDPKSTRPTNSSAPTRSSPGKISRTRRCIRTPRWSGVSGKVAEECGDPWEDRYHFRTKPTVRAHLRNQKQLYGAFCQGVSVAVPRRVGHCSEQLWETEETRRRSRDIQ